MKTGVLYIPPVLVCLLLSACGGRPAWEKSSEFVHALAGSSFSLVDGVFETPFDKAGIIADPKISTTISRQDKAYLRNSVADSGFRYIAGTEEGNRILAEVSWTTTDDSNGFGTGRRVIFRDLHDPSLDTTDPMGAHPAAFLYADTRYLIFLSTMSHAGVPADRRFHLFRYDSEDETSVYFVEDTTTFDFSLINSWIDKMLTVLPSYSVLLGGPCYDNGDFYFSAGWATPAEIPISSGYSTHLLAAGIIRVSLNGNQFTDPSTTIDPMADQADLNSDLNHPEFFGSNVFSPVLDMSDPSALQAFYMQLAYIGEFEAKTALVSTLDCDWTGQLYALKFAGDQLDPLSLLKLPGQHQSTYTIEDSEGTPVIKTSGNLLLDVAPDGASVYYAHMPCWVGNSLIQLSDAPLEECTSVGIYPFTFTLRGEPTGLPADW
jgi:hypothetical protein